MINITFSTCWYILKSKFDAEVYKKWFSNFLGNVNNFYLVVYTNKESYKMLKKYNKNPNIKIILVEFEEFYNYKYKEQFVKNHNNTVLKNLIDWKLNMLWSEKISFVKKTIEHKYFDTEYYGWCDIGYFRGRPNDINVDLIKTWPNTLKISKLNKDKVHYGIINNNQEYMNFIIMMLRNRLGNGLPMHQLPQNQLSVAGGFFILTRNKIDWWFKEYDKKLNLYLTNNYVVKDDQMLIIDCISQNINDFELYTEEEEKYDNWFMFQRILI
jgi:hypothetical protein